MIDGQMDLYDVAALAWVGAFALFAAEYGPMLLARAPMTRQYCTGSRGVRA